MCSFSPVWVFEFFSWSDCLRSESIAVGLHLFARDSTSVLSAKSRSHSCEYYLSAHIHLFRCSAFVHHTILRGSSIKHCHEKNAHLKLSHADTQITVQKINRPTEYKRKRTKMSARELHTRAAAELQAHLGLRSLPPACKYHVSNVVEMLEKLYKKKSPKKLTNVKKLAAKFDGHSFALLAAIATKYGVDFIDVINDGAVMKATRVSPLCAAVVSSDAALMYKTPVIVRSTSRDLHPSERAVAGTEAGC